MWKDRVRFVVRLLCLGASCAFFLNIMLFSKYGIHEVDRLKREVAQLRLKLEAEKGEVVALQEHLKAWHDDPFLKEKAAREDLLMGRSDEKVYVLN